MNAPIFEQNQHEIAYTRNQYYLYRSYFGIIILHDHFKWGEGHGIDE